MQHQISKMNRSELTANTLDFDTMLKRLSVLNKIPVVATRHSETLDDDDDDDDEDLDEENEDDEEEEEDEEKIETHTLKSPDLVKDAENSKPNSNVAKTNAHNLADELDEFLIPAQTRTLSQESSESNQVVVVKQEPHEVGFFLEPLNIKTDFSCSVNNQKSPRTQLFDMALQLESEKKERVKLAHEVNFLKHQIENVLEKKIKQLEKENQDLRNEDYYSKRIIKELKSANSGIDSSYAQVDQLRSEITKLKSEIQSLQMTNGNLTKQVEKLKKYENLVKDIDFCQVNNKLYQMVGKIGQGGFSEVYHCIAFKESKSYAIKKTDLSKLDQENVSQLMNEIELIKRLQNTNKVIQLFDFECQRQKHLLYMVTELGSTDLNVFFKKELQKHKCVKEPIRSYYWQKMLEALYAVHKEGVIHSDIKPSNFIVVGCEVKLIDFNISTSMISERTSITAVTDCGTLHYMAPETLMRDNDKIKINQKADVWSMGVILYLLVYGRLPFQHIKNQYKMLHAICDPLKKDMHFEPLDDRYLLDCLHKCLTHETKDRPTVEQLLLHPYLSRKGT